MCKYLIDSHPFARFYFCICYIYLTRSNKSEAQAQAQQQNHSTPLTEASGEILNNTGNLELQQATRHLTCNLRNMQLKKIKRAEKKGTESVMDEKFALLFQSKFQTGDMQLNVNEIKFISQYFGILFAKFVVLSN